MRLQDQVVIVTGSTSGIGEAIARRAVAEGARVMLHGLEPELGEQVLADLGEAARLHIGNLEDPATPATLVEQTVDAFGRLDCIVNNAAWVCRSTVQDSSPDYFNQVMAINARAPMLMVQAGLPHLEKAGGCVLNIGSVNAWSGEPTFLLYSMSKGALMTMTRNLGDTLYRDHGVRVNQINPEWVLTENEKKVQENNGNPPDWFEKIPACWAPAGRLIQPEEIASVAVPWMCKESVPFSGTVFEACQYPFVGRNPPRGVD
ncbi:MAG: SDR family NAD(P)-dependent oxidoreductase [Verrucomicrobiota bacterium]